MVRSAHPPLFFISPKELPVCLSIVNTDVMNKLVGEDEGWAGRECYNGRLREIKTIQENISSLSRFTDILFFTTAMPWVRYQGAGVFMFSMTMSAITPEREAKLAYRIEPI